MVLLPFLFPFLSSVDYPFPFFDPDLPLSDRVDLLVSNLTLTEKVSQMMNAAASIPRLNIPPYEWWNEALHGIARSGNATVFPQTIGLSATFDPPLILTLYSFVSDEARAKHQHYVSRSEYGRYTGLTFWTPNINIFRDPRWGRGQETFGEDPFLTSSFATRVVAGLQGNSSSYYKVHACAKHFAVHSGPESSRHTFDVHPSARDLAQTYFPAFRTLIESGVAEVMCAYNRVFGQPACASDFLFGKLRAWNFSGIVTSDCYAINDFLDGHKTHPDAEHASADAVRNGTTIECGSQFRALVNATRLGLIEESEITHAVKELFKHRFLLGMFDPVERVDYARIPYEVVQSAEHAAHALAAARESVVLLENDGILPLNGSAVRLLVVGPNADQIDMLWGNYHGFNPYGTTTILEGIAARGNVKFAEGCDFVDGETVGEDLWREIGGFDGEFFANVNLSGESVSRRIERIRWHDGGEASFAGGGFAHVNYSGRFTGNFTAVENESLEIVVAYRYGIRYSFGNLAKYEDWTATSVYEPGEEWRTASNTTKIEVTEGVTYEIRVEYFHGIGEAILNFTLLRRLTVEESFFAVAEKAGQSDVIVFVGGITPSLEGEEMPVGIEGFAGGDRTLIELPQVQREFLEDLKRLGKPVIFIICAGSAIAFNKTGLNAVIDAFYPGEAGGKAVADVLFGDYNPAGRLPITFYTATTELDDFSDYNMSTGEKGRTYRYYKGTPLYPFGHGLSYTQFQYRDIEVRGNPLIGEEVKVGFVVKNTGQRDGDEVSQIYVSAVGVQGEPIKALRWFKRQGIEAGKEVEVSAVLGVEAFEIFDEKEEKLVLREGSFKIAVGGSSADEALIVKEVKFTATVSPSVSSHPSVSPSLSVSGAQPTDQGEEEGTAGFPVWGIVLIVVGGVALIGVVVVVIRHNWRNRAKYEPTEPSTRSGMSLI